MKKFDPTLNTVFTDDGKPVIAPMGRPSGSIIEATWRLTFSAANR